MERFFRSLKTEWMLNNVEGFIPEDNDYRATESLSYPENNDEND